MNDKTIYVDETTKNKLKQLKKHHTETLGNVIKRLHSYYIWGIK